MIKKTKTRVRGSNVKLMLDLTKAYDKLSWLFLTKVLRQFGIYEEFIDMVSRIVSNCQYSLILNGQSTGFFLSTRGVSQVDPLSPSLFILASEVTSRGLKDLVVQKQITSFPISQNCPIIIHLAFTKWRQQHSEKPY
ncbi:hypothetical protein LguiB_004342 [Lonicera macranthoides]